MMIVAPALRICTVFCDHRPPSRGAGGCFSKACAPVLQERRTLERGEQRILQPLRPLAGARGALPPCSRGGQRRDVREARRALDQRQQFGVDRYILNRVRGRIDAGTNQSFPVLHALGVRDRPQAETVRFLDCRRDSVGREIGRVLALADP